MHNAGKVPKDNRLGHVSRPVARSVQKPTTRGVIQQVFCVEALSCHSKHNIPFRRLDRGDNAYRSKIHFDSSSSFVLVIVLEVRYVIIRQFEQDYEDEDEDQLRILRTRSSTVPGDVPRRHSMGFS